MEDDVGETGAIRAAVRAAKKSYQPAKIGEPAKRSSTGSKKRSTKKRPAVSAAPGKGKFDKELGQRSAREGVRAKKSDIIGGMGKKKGSKRKGK